MLSGIILATMMSGTAGDVVSVESDYERSARKGSIRIEEQFDKYHTELSSRKGIRIDAMRDVDVDYISRKKTIRISDTNQ